MTTNGAKRGGILAAWCTIAVLALASGCAQEPPKDVMKPGDMAAPQTSAEEAANVVEVTVDGSGFHPDRITAHAGQPVTLAITRTTNETCGTEIVIPSQGIDTKLPLNERVEVTVTPAAVGEVAFACAMDMHKGTIVVE
jgi:plastocyanin domain-containing protein